MTLIYPETAQPLGPSIAPATALDSADLVFLARQPIFDTSGQVQGYELLTNNPAGAVLHDAWLTFGLSRLIGDTKAFITFTRDLLVAGHAEALPPESTAIQLHETIKGDLEVVRACQTLKSRGYTLALDNFVYCPTLDPLICLADVIKLNFQNPDPAEHVRRVRRVAPTRGPKFLATLVETHEEYQRAKELGFGYFQGSFFRKPETLKTRPLNGVSATPLRLLQCVAKPDVDFDELDAIISVDVSVTHRLIKYLASPAFGLRAEVRSIRHGLVLLGREETRKFASLVALSEIGSGKPPEILVTAAARAKMCELLAEDVGLADRKAELFLLGALSLIDAMLDQPMSGVLRELPLIDDLKQALQGASSPLGDVLEFVTHYELGDWVACEKFARAHGLSDITIFDRYRDAVSWATTLVRTSTPGR